MKDLVSLQRAFQRHILRPGNAMAGAVASTPRADAARRIAVYAEGYRVRLAEVLRSDFPALRSVLEDAGFDRMTSGYIEAHPSHHPNLRWYGQKLPHYLSRSPRWRRRPLLAELARFEWALGLAFDAADDPLISAEDVSRVPPAAWPGMRIRLHSSVQQLALFSNAPKIWRAIDAGDKPPTAARRKESRTWLVWRKGHGPFYRALPPIERWALDAAARGLDFASLINGLRRFVGAESAAQTGAQFLRNWLSEGLVCGVDPDPGIPQSKRAP